MARVAIQGELGSNSHLAAMAMLEDLQPLCIVPYRVSADVVTGLLVGDVDAAVLPIENTLHGSVVEHYDLLLHAPLRMDREYSLHIQHNLIAAPGVRLADVRRVLSHPVALSQCRGFLASVATQATAEPFYDTAGAVHHVVTQHLQDAAALAPLLAAEVYGGDVLATGLEDNPLNFTRFHLLRRAEDTAWTRGVADKLSVVFTVDHRPGTLVQALSVMAAAGTDLTRIESRPVPGSPWEYSFYVDMRLPAGLDVAGLLEQLAPLCRSVRSLGSYRAAA